MTRSMKEKKDGLSSSPKDKDNEDGFFRVSGHRRTSSFSSFAKAYKSNRNDKYSSRASSNAKLNKTSTDINISDDTHQQLIAVLEHQVSEGDKQRREMAEEIGKLKGQLQRAEAQIALLKQANSNLYEQLINMEKYPKPGRLRPIDVELCLSGELRNESTDSHKSCDSSQWGDPLNTTIYADMHDDSSYQHESELNSSTIISNIQANSINEINHIIDINNPNVVTNNNDTNNFHTITSSNANSFSTESCALSTASSASFTSDTSICSSLNNSQDVNMSFTEKACSPRRVISHKRRGRGSDTETSPKLDDKYQRRHSEGKVLRIAGLQKQVRQAVLQILNTNYAESEDEWPAVYELLQGLDLSSAVLPPSPRHLVHAGFVREGESLREGYWIDDVLLLLFKDFLLLACQPMGDITKARYLFKEVISLNETSRAHSWVTDTEHYGIAITTDQISRSFLISSKEECDKWMSVITKQISALTVLSSLQGALRYYLIGQCEGFVVEPTTVVAAGETKLCLDEPRKGIYHYQSFFYNKPHFNYVGGSNAYPVVISIEDKTTKFALSPSLILRRNSDAVPSDTESITHRALVRTQEGDECVCVAIPTNLARSAQIAHAEVLAQLPQILPSISLPQLKVGATLFRVKSTDLENDLVQYESNNMRRSHKIAVVYCAKGAHTEAEMLQTSHEKASPDFLQFLSLLGQEVTLKGWSDYNGGLDVKNDTDGTHSIFTNFWGIPVMFHVSTMLPDDRHNPNVAKKRHIGNDIVVIVFKDHDDDSLLIPSTFKSHLNHVFCVVRHVNNPDGSVSYKLSFCAKEGIGSFTPALPSPPIFAKDAKFKHFLLAKIVNAERAAMRSAPFAKRHTLARFTFLKNLWRQYNVQPKEIDESCGQIYTM